MGILTKRKLALLSNVFLFLTVAVFALVCFAPGVAVPASGSSPYYRGSAEGKVSIMFNVYEGEEIVDGILGILKEHGARATFFIGGCYADDHPEMLEKIAIEGHELASHGYFHLDHSKLSFDRNREEMESSCKLIQAVTGITPTLFAPPSGAFSANTMKAADALGLTVVMWSKDTIDWRSDATRDKVIRRATDKVKEGDFILAHPKQVTLSALGEILDILSAKGLYQTTVSENLFGQSGE